jgi:hypothetical protein
MLTKVDLCCVTALCKCILGITNSVPRFPSFTFHRAAGCAPQFRSFITLQGSIRCRMQTGSGRVALPKINFGVGMR